MKTIRKILSMALTLILLLGIIPTGVFAATYTDAAPFASAATDLWQDPQVIPRTEPMELLVIVAQFKDYNEYTDEYFKEKYYNEVFASGAIEDGTYTVNDYFKEISNGQFYYEPIVLNGNTTGVYPLYLDENFIDDKIPEYCYKLFEQLIKQGLDPQNFLRQEGSALSYFSRRAQVMIYFPHSIPHMGSYYLINENAYSYSAIVCVDYANSIDDNQGTPPNVVCHELGHTLGFKDLYLQGNFLGLMNDASTCTDKLDKIWEKYPSGPVFVPPHLDPFSKIAMHWYYPQVIESTSTVRLYPASNSEKYNPVIVKTDNINQYFIIENRQLSGFDMYLNTGHIWGINNGVDTDDMILDVVGKNNNIIEANYKGINIWRIDALSYNDYDRESDNLVGSAARKWNWPVNILHYPGEKANLLKYENLEDINDLTRIDTGIEIEFLSENEDGSITVSIIIPNPPATQTVTFIDWDKTELKKQTVEYGKSATAPAHPSREGYDPDGWDNPFDNVTSDLTVTAKYTPKSYTVTFIDWDGTELKKQTVESGKSATAPAAPSRTGYDFTGWDKAFINVTSDLTITAQYKWHNPFIDVNETDGWWYYDAIEYCYTHGIVKGTSANLFSPNLSLSRAMIVTILYRLEGEPDVSGLKNPFNDAFPGWSVEAVKWAYENKIILGRGNGSFGPEDDITRQDLAVILSRYAEFKGLTLPVVKDYTGFKDDSLVSDYAAGAVKAFYQAEIINGKGGNMFDPLGTATRAEAVTMLHRFLMSAGIA